MTTKTATQKTAKSASEPTPKNAVSPRKSGASKNSVSKKKSRPFAKTATAIIRGDARLSGEHQNLCALLGQGGHTQIAQQLDASVLKFYQAHGTAEIGRRLGGQFAGRTLFRIDVFDDCGMTDPRHPLLYPAALADRTEKLFRQQKLDAIFSIKTHLTQSESQGQANGILMYARALAFAPAGTTAERLQSALRSTTTVLTTKVPKIGVEAVVVDNLGREVGKLLRPDLAVLKLVDDDGGNISEFAVASCGLTSSTEDLLRLLSASASVPPALFLRGTKGPARDIVSQVTGRVKHAHRGRIDGGDALPASFDHWSCFARCHLLIGSGDLPARTDIPLKSPPSVPKAKKIKPVRPGEVDRYLKKKGRHKIRGKGPKKQSISTAE